IHLFQSPGLAKVPGFELLAGNPDEGVLAPGCVAEPGEPCLQGAAVAAVIVVHYDKAHTRLPPHPELPWETPLQILLALVRYTEERQAGDEPGEQPFEQNLHGVFL